MATFHLTFRPAYQVSPGQGLASAKPRAAQTITTSGTSQASTITAQEYEVATMVVSGGNVFIAVGSAPTAASGAGDFIPDGGRLELGALKDADKIAVINA